MPKTMPSKNIVASLIDSQERKYLMFLEPADSHVAYGLWLRSSIHFKEKDLNSFKLQFMSNCICR